MLIQVVVQILLLFLSVCIGEVGELNFIVVITSSKSDCNALIRTSIVLHTLCSCVTVPKGDSVVPVPVDSIKVVTRVGVKAVSHIIVHPKCKISDGIYVYNSALVFLQSQINLMVVHRPVREPAFSRREFDPAMKLRMPCSVLGAVRTRCEPTFLSDCVNIDEYMDPICAAYLSHMTFCMKPENLSKPAILGAPLVCSSGLVWGVKLSDHLNFTLFMKTTAFDELEKSSSPPAIRIGSYLVLVLASKSIESLLPLRQ